jgi:hypothetical protein
MIRPKTCQQMKKVNGESLKRFKIKRYLIVTSHNHLLTSFSELLIKLGISKNAKTFWENFANHSLPRHETG